MILGSTLDMGGWAFSFLPHGSLGSTESTIRILYHKDQFSARDTGNNFIIQRTDGIAQTVNHFF